MMPKGLNEGFAARLPNGRELYVGRVPTREGIVLSTYEDPNSVVVLAYFLSEEAASKFLEILSGKRP